MNNLDDVLNGLIPEEVPEDIYSSDQYPPRFQPGQRVRFLFKLEEKDPVTLSNDKKIVTVNFIGEALAVIGKGGIETPVAPMSSGDQPRLRFQRADSRSFTNSEGIAIPSRLHKLYRGLVGRDAAKATGAAAGAVVTALLPLDGRETFEATIGWKLYLKDEQIEYSTTTTKDRDVEKADGTMAYYRAWPKDETGAFSKAIDGTYGQDFIATVIEKKVKSQQHSTVEVGA